MIKVLIVLLTKNLNLPFNITQLTLAIKVSLEKRRGKKITKGKVWNPSNKDIGLENYA